MRRRGPAYLSYLALGVGWPKLAYRFGWGPQAPRVVRSMFYAVMVLTTSAPELGDGPALDAAIASREALCDGDLDVAEIEALMNRAHAAGITRVRDAFESIGRMPDGTARFTALPRARVHRRRGIFFAADRDADRIAFNQRFDAALLTEASARAELRARKAAVPSGYRDYAPIDFGGGLTLGQILSTDSGTGRWDFFNRRVVAPIVAGKRVVDLGCNNASMPLMMLRAGARSVVGIEQTPQIADLARLNARILAWRDMRSYDFRVVIGDMRVFLVEHFEPVDVVTAFCSLYYLPEEDMRRVIQKASAIGATLILQSNEAIDNLPARAAQLRALMIENGYSDVDSYDVPGFTRPILIGRTAAGSGRSSSQLEPQLAEA
jgi:Methyltransferase domain